MSEKPIHDPAGELFKNYLRHYRNTVDEDHNESYETIKTLHPDRLPRWLDRIDKKARILDAGCATGYLLGLLWADGYENLKGVELSEQLSTIAQTSLPEAIEITNDDIRQHIKTLDESSLDVVILHHVLEHIPREFTIELLRNIYNCISSGGYLNIKVPNACFLLAGYQLHGDFTHVAHFNERSLIQVLEAACFEPERVELILHPPILFWSWQHKWRALLRIFNRIRWHLHLLLHKLLCIAIDQTPIPRAFEAEIEVLARK